MFLDPHLQGNTIRRSVLLRPWWLPPYSGRNRGKEGAGDPAREVKPCRGSCAFVTPFDLQQCGSHEVRGFGWQLLCNQEVVAGSNPVISTRSRPPFGEESWLFETVTGHEGAAECDVSEGNQQPRLRARRPGA